MRRQIEGASEDKEDRMRWQTLASSSRRRLSLFSKLDLALRKLLRLDSVSDVGLSGWRLYLCTDNVGDVQLLEMLHC